MFFYFPKHNLENVASAISDVMVFEFDDIKDRSLTATKDGLFSENLVKALCQIMGGYLGQVELGHSVRCINASEHLCNKASQYFDIFDGIGLPQDWDHSDVFRYEGVSEYNAEPSCDIPLYLSARIG